MSETIDFYNLLVVNVMINYDYCTVQFRDAWKSNDIQNSSLFYLKEGSSLNSILRIDHYFT